MSDQPVVIVPARLASTRLPFKPLADICGKPMIVRTLDQARKAGFNTENIIAAVDSERLVRCVEKAGYKAVMTDPALSSGSDRVCAVADSLGFDNERILINLQGDEPAMPAAPLVRVAALLQQDSAADWATLACAGSKADRENPNVVKLVCAMDGYALYFSRSPIPYDRSQEEAKSDSAERQKQDSLSVLPSDTPEKDTKPVSDFVCLRHIGLYAYRAGALRKMTKAPVCLLEHCEKLEQLRALYLGQKIRVDVWPAPLPHGVDTPEDLAAMRSRDWTRR